MKFSVETRVAAAITRKLRSTDARGYDSKKQRNETRRHAQNNPVNVDELIKDGSLTNLADAEKQSRGSRQQNDA